MGCGCKQQPQQPVTPKGITPIQIQSVQPVEIDYTIEELIRVKDYISSTNKTETERQFVETFMINKVGLVIPPYCDQNCLNNLRVSVNKLELRLK
jgi:hypothetical protein